MKRYLTLAFSILMVILCLPISSSANSSTINFSSFYLASYNVFADTGDSDGTIDINFDVTSSKAATSIGVSKIEIYKSNGTFVTSISGNTSNGLTCNNTGTHDGVYTYEGNSGTSYYAKVTVFAKCSTGSDSRVITTEVVKA